MEWSYGAWLRPGRVLQVPVGYVLLGIGAAILLTVGGYIAGFSRGKTVERLAFEQEFSVSWAGEATGDRPRDPLEDGAPGGRPDRPRSSGPLLGPAPASADPGRIHQPAPHQDAGDWGPVLSDPRQEGVNYFILAETNQDGALRLAEYCRAHGLETYVVQARSPRLRWVIALPGFEPGQRNTPAVQDLERLIHRVGDRWQREERGATNLRDAYPHRFGR